MHRLALILLVSLTSCPSGNRPPPPNAHIFIVEKEMTPFEGEVSGLRLFTPTGYIRVFEGPKLRVQIQYQISATNEKRAQEVADGCKPMWRQVDQRADFLIGPPKDYPMERLGIGLEVYVPPGWDLDLGTRSGLLDTSTYRSRNQQLRSLSGDLRIGESTGLLTFRCDRGTIEIKGAFKKVRGRSEQGTLRIMKTAEAGNLRYRTKRGNVHVHLGLDSSVRVGLRTLEGSVHTNVALTRETERMPGGWKMEDLKIGKGDKACQLDLVIEKGALLLGMD